MKFTTLYDQSIQNNYFKYRKLLKYRIPKKNAKLLFKRLRESSVEKDVEDAWKSIFSDFYIKNNKGKYSDNTKYSINSPLNTDGFIFPKENNLVYSLRILMEFKKGTDLTNTYDKCRIVIQLIHYMYNMYQNNKPLPTVLVGADENQSFVLLASNFYKYLSKNYNWDCSPSEAYKLDTQLMKDLQLDTNIRVFPFQISNVNFKQKYSSLLDIFHAIHSIVQANEQDNFKIKVTPSNILGMFDEFSNISYKNPRRDGIDAFDSVTIFMKMITGRSRDEYYFIPSNHNILHLPGDRKVSVYGNKLESFINHYDRNLSPKEIDDLNSIADRLIKTNKRRYRGDFWTPSIWCQRANQIFEDCIGENYKNDSIVWDCAAGVRNLTRDFYYNNLFISTYHNAELELGKGYNPEVKKAFQYDFLNDDVDLNPNDNPNPNDWKMPNKLFNTLIKASKNNKKIIFYTNPPYGTANNWKNKGTSKSGISSSKMNIYMRNNNYGKASQQLYAQFFARIIKLVDDFNLSNVSIGFFTHPRFFTGGIYWKKFNHHLFSKFKFIKGIYLNSGEFSDVSNTWPVTFSVFNLKNNFNLPLQNRFTFSVEESKLNENNKIVINHLCNHSTKMVYSNNSLRSWANSINSKDYMESKYPQLSSALKESKCSKPYGKLLNNSLGYEVANSDNIGKGQSLGSVWIASSSAYEGHGFNVMPSNFNRAIVHFAARRSVTENWINHIDNYTIPDIHNPIYSEFVNDALIFSLFDRSSNQAAYRRSGWTNVNVDGKWINNWFWLSNNYMMELANKYNNNDVYLDARNDKNRYVYNQIQKRKFSSEAMEVLDKATDVLIDTFQFRSVMNDDDPDLYLNAWDAGWYQIKQINHKYPVKSYEMFRKSFKKLKSKIEKNVYKLGML